MSILHRLGADASLSLGNKKPVDITVVEGAGRALTVDVKGVAGRHDWPADNVETERDGHFVALVSFEGHIDDPQKAPSTWIVPVTKLQPFIKQYQGRKVVSRSAIVS